MSKERFRIMRLLVVGFVLATYVVAGAARSSKAGVSAGKEEIKSASVMVRINLGQDYVRSVSRIGVGAAGLWYFVGPFTNNVVTLYGSVEKEIAGEVKVIDTFSKRLEWGPLNSMSLYVSKDSSILFKLSVSGTREGRVDIGSVPIRSASSYDITIDLTEPEAMIEVEESREIKPEQREGKNKRR